MEGICFPTCGRGFATWKDAMKLEEMEIGMMEGSGRTDSCVHVRCLRKCLRRKGIDNFCWLRSDQVTKLLDEVQTDHWTVEAGKRATRSTGVAAGLLGAFLAGTGVHIIALVGGPCSEGPGMHWCFKRGSTSMDWTTHSKIKCFCLWSTDYKTCNRAECNPADPIIYWTISGKNYVKYWNAIRNLLHPKCNSSVTAKPCRCN